jgi:hypothetical protein
MTSAHYFDGRSARLHQVHIHAQDGAIMLGGDVNRSYPLEQARLAEPFEHAPAVLYFADGARCEVSDPAAGAELSAALGYRKTFVQRLQARRAETLTCLLLMMILIAVIAFWGVPAAAERIAAALPPEVDQTLGASSLATLEKRGLLEPTGFSEDRLARLQAIMRKVAPQDEGLRLRLLVRRSPGIGRNALALPDGTILITDQMAWFVIKEFKDDDEAADAALAGILAHEIGHVRLRHSARALTRASLTAALSATLFGDFSAVAAGAPALLLNLEYSRDMETEADDYALARMRERGIDTNPLAHIFDVLEAESGDAGPSWAREAGNYVSTHPDGAARSARFYTEEQGDEE